MTISKSFLTAGLLVFAMTMGSVAQGSESTTERNRQFITQAFEQWAAGGGHSSRTCWRPT